MKLLFVCTHNRCRSILAEAVTNGAHNPGIQAISAGSQPAGLVHPLTLHYLQQRGYATAGLASKSWDTPSAAEADFVITVCDSAAGESCPLWLGKVPKIHWGLADPSANTDDPRITEEAFNSTIDTLQLRIQRLAASLADHPDPAGIQLTLEALASCYAPPHKGDGDI